MLVAPLWRASWPSGGAPAARAPGRLSNCESEAPRVSRRDSRPELRPQRPPVRPIRCGSGKSRPPVQAPAVAGTWHGVWCGSTRATQLAQARCSGASLSQPSCLVVAASTAPGSRTPGEETSGLHGLALPPCQRRSRRRQGNAPVEAPRSPQPYCDDRRAPSTSHQVAVHGEPSEPPLPRLQLCKAHSPRGRLPAPVPLGTLAADAHSAAQATASTIDRILVPGPSFLGVFGCASAAAAFVFCRRERSSALLEL